MKNEVYWLNLFIQQLYRCTACTLIIYNYAACSPALHAHAFMHARVHYLIYMYRPSSDLKYLSDNHYTLIDGFIIHPDRIYLTSTTKTAVQKSLK
jgi:hypothetical protein